MDLNQFADLGGIVLKIVSVLLGLVIAFSALQTRFQQRRHSVAPYQDRRSSVLGPPLPLPPDTGLPPTGPYGSPPARPTGSFGMDPMRVAVREELRAERRESFWPNFWLNVGTNFVVGGIFFGLGIATTLYFGVGR